MFKHLTAGTLGAVTLVVALAACGGGAKSATPAALTGDPTTYDGQSVSVSGTAKNPQIRQGRRGKLLTFQLCDDAGACINVVEFGDAAASAAVTDGASLSLTGTFRESFGRVKRIENVLVVGGRPGGFTRGSGAPDSSPSPAST